MGTKEEIRHYILKVLKDADPAWQTDTGVSSLLAGVMGGNGQPLLKYGPDYENVKLVLDELEKEGIVESRPRGESTIKEYRYKPENSHQCNCPDCPHG